MKKKYLIHDYLNKFPLDNPYYYSKISSTKIKTGKTRNLPKLKQIILTSNLNNKSFFSNSSNPFKGGTETKNNPLSIELLKLYIIFSRIFGQTPQLLKAHKSVANWNVRKNMNIGILLSLRACQNTLFFKDYLFKFFLFLVPLLNQKDSFFILNSHSKTTKNIDSLIFGLSSLIPFNPIFPDIEYYKYSNIINEIKNSSEFIGCRINILCQFPIHSSLINSSISQFFFDSRDQLLKEIDTETRIKIKNLSNTFNFYHVNQNISLFKRDFILSYFQFPVPSAHFTSQIL